jgi:hypothetical protein
MLRRTGKKACESASDDRDDSAAHSTALLPKTRQGGSRSITRCLESACTIAASAAVVLAFLDGFARIQAVLQRAYLLPRSARSRRITTHSATRAQRVPRSLSPLILTSGNAGDGTPGARPQYSSMKTAALARAFDSAHGNEKAVSPAAALPGLDFSRLRPPRAPASAPRRSDRNNRGLYFSTISTFTF